MSDEPPVISSVVGCVGQLTLNRPKALHALNLRMCEIILETLETWTEDNQVKVVLIDHAVGSRGFCAGGDIRMLAESGATDAKEAREFFKSEYRMNAKLQSFPKPIVSFIDGITMGGGVGLSVHGSHRVASENTVFAMPETGIGLFPDVGGGWFLPRLEGELGVWLALTGHRVRGADVAGIGVATHYTQSDRLTDLKNEIVECQYDEDTLDALSQILDRFTDSVTEFSLKDHVAAINRCFCKDEVSEIMTALQSENDEWADQQLKVLQTKSPETMKVALHQLRQGAKLESFRDNMRMEYRIGWRKVQSPDFLEGVRAVIVDKDNAPKWNPSTVEDVRDEDVQKYFAHLGTDELTF